MKHLFLPLFFASVLVASAQNTIEWDGVYQLKLSDFQSPATQIGEDDHYSLHTASQIDFSYQMTNAEFMFTKNFNSKVGCSFKRGSSALSAPDSIVAHNLVRFAQFEFDLSELYARKFRKKIFENKGAFSNPSFFKPLFDDIQEEFAVRHTIASKDTGIGQDEEKLNELHQAVLVEIQSLSDFCKTCKPPKK